MIECAEWKAWYDSRSRRQTRLHVQAECSAPDTDIVELTLQRHTPPRGKRQGPAIRGPGYIARSGSPPVFSVRVPPGRYYCVELTTRMSLLDPGRPRSERPADAFYASWTDQKPSRSETFATPPRAWDRLRTGERLFYRLVLTDRPDGWLNAAAWPREWTRTPFLRITDERPSASDWDLPLVLVSRERPRQPDGPAARVSVRWAEAVADIYEAVSILTNDVTIPIEVAR